MKFCIIGPDDRKKTDLMLIESAKKVFDSVLYIPYSNISLTFGNEIKVSYKNVDVTCFHSILPRIPRNRSIFGYLLLNTLKSYSPVKAQAFLMTSDKSLMFNILKKEGIATPKMFFVNSAESLSSVIKSGNPDFPVLLRMAYSGREAMLANNAKEAKTIMDTYKKFNSPVYIEELSKKKYTQAFVVGNSVVAGIARKPKRKIDVLTGEGKAKKVKVSGRNKTLALGAAVALKTDFAMIEIMNKKVIDANLCPMLSNVEEVTGVNVVKELLEYIKSRTEMEEKPVSWLSRFFEDLGTSVKDVFD